MASTLVAVLIFLAPPAAAAPPGKVSYWNTDGKEIMLDASKNKLTALHFWATWCVPCVKELPEVDAIAGRYKGKGLQIIAISMDSPAQIAAVKKFLKLNNIKNLDLYFDLDTRAFRNLQLKGLPSTVFIDWKGVEVWRASGPLEWTSEETTIFLRDTLK